MLSAAERVDKLHRSGAVKRNPRYQIFKTVGTQVFHEALHTAGFELKHSVGVTFGNKRVGAAVRITYLIKVYYFTVIFVNIVAAFFYIGKSNQRQKVHFQHTERLYFLGNVLGGYVLAVSRKRYVICYTLLTYYHARRMNTRLARHSFYFKRHIDNAAQRIVRFVNFAKLAVTHCAQLVKFFSEFGFFVFVLLGVNLFAHSVQAPAQQIAYRSFSVHYFGYPVRFRIGHAHNSTDVFNGVFRRHSTKRYYLADIFRAVFSTHVFYCLLTPVRTKVYIEVGHRNAVGVQKSFEKQIVLKRFHIGNAYRIRNY